MFVAMSIQHRFVNKVTIQYGVAPEHLVVGTLEVGLDGVDLVHEILHSDDEKVQGSDILLDWRRCTACNLAGEAGRGECTARREMQKDKRAARNTRRGRITETKGKKRPCGLQKAKCSL
jgi:hypothetical protein